MKSNPVLQAFGFGLLAAFFWGTHSVIVRYLTADIHGLTIAALRLYIAAAAPFAPNERAQDHGEMSHYHRALV